MPRLLITADLHYDHGRSKDLAAEVIDRMNAAGGDILLVVGDTAHVRLRLVDVARVEALEKQVAGHFEELSRACVEFFLADNAFQPLLDRLESLVTRVGEVSKAAELVPLKTELDAVQEGLSLLSDTISALPIDDATVRTKILDGTSSAFAQQNRMLALLAPMHREIVTR